MKLLLDQGLPRSLTALLSAAGFECVHVADLGMAQAVDADILRFAADSGWVVVTRDADFHNIVAVRGLIRPSIVRLRQTEGMKGDALFDRIMLALNASTEALMRGALISADSKNVRTRLLPIGSRE